METNFWRSKVWNATNCCLERLHQRQICSCTPDGLHRTKYLEKDGDFSRDFSSDRRFLFLKSYPILPTGSVLPFGGSTCAVSDFCLYVMWILACLCTKNSMRLSQWTHSVGTTNPCANMQSHSCGLLHSSLFLNLKVLKVLLCAFPSTFCIIRVGGNSTCFCQVFP